MEQEGRSSFGVESGSDFRSSQRRQAEICPTCGRSSIEQNRGLHEFLGRLGISEESIENLKGKIEDADIEEMIGAARDHLVAGRNRATAYAKENPGKVAAGIAALAIGAGLLVAGLNRD